MNDNRTVILLHGLFMRPIVMWPFARALTMHGHTPMHFSYPTTRRTLQENAQAFAEYLDTLNAPFDIVAHSLGGLVALGALQHLAVPRAMPRSGRIVALASPLCGSAVGRSVARLPWAECVLGKSASAWSLDGGTLTVPPGWELGVVAGTRPLGLGVLFSPLSTPHDGTVSCDETHLEGLTDYVEVPNTHTGIIFSPAVARLTSQFLKTGRFGIDEDR